MKYIKNTIKKTVFILALLAIVPLFSPTNAFAEDPPSGESGEKTCGEVKVAILECETKKDAEGNEISPIFSILEIALNIAVGIVGVVAVGGLIYGAILYSSARDNQEQAKKAIEVIRNVIIGIIVFVLMWSIIQYIIPSRNVIQENNSDQNPAQSTGQPT